MGKYYSPAIRLEVAKNGQIIDACFISIRDYVEFELENGDGVNGVVESIDYENGIIKLEADFEEYEEYVDVKITDIASVNRIEM
jgi:hypothetical protein